MPRTDTAAVQSSPVKAWAIAGAVLLAFELYVLGRWVFGSHLVTTPTGPDRISHATKAYYVFVQAAVSLGALACIYAWVIRPWRKQRQLTTDGMLTLAAGMLFFWDMSMNYTSTQLFYNSNMVNYGAWANGSWPGWLSPAANRLPEPIFITIPGYTALVFTQAVLVLWLLRKAMRRWPSMGKIGQAGFIVLGLTVIDSIIEIALLRMGIYAYPGAIKSITLFAGHTYQFPLTEGFFFGGLGVGALAMLMHFRDDRGRTVVENGVDRLKVGTKGRQWVKFLAIFGAVHLTFLFVYVVPNQWLATHTDAYPTSYPSYLTNGMCADGPDHNLCPGPGVAIPRPGR